MITKVLCVVCSRCGAKASPASSQPAAISAAKVDGFKRSMGSDLCPNCQAVPDTDRGA